MSAYVIFIRDKIIDPDEMATYAALAREARGQHKLRPLVFYGDKEALEGPEVDGVVVVEFETMDAAKAWYNSPAYQEAKAHRLKGAQYRVILADGLPSPN
ncbi:MAG TPA: DUF1330 domain-containing protein [Caulobacteraceae bacterium]|jgi:uncharacterized protein (DUF1330 family)